MQFKNHRSDVFRVAGLDGHVLRFEPGEVGVHHRTVPFDGEDQRDVHRDTLAEHRRDGGNAFLHRGDLDE